MNRSLWKLAFGLSLTLFALPGDVLAGRGGGRGGGREGGGGEGGGMNRGGGREGGGGGMNRGGGGGMNRGGEGGGMNRGGEGGGMNRGGGDGGMNRGGGGGGMNRGADGGNFGGGSSTGRSPAMNTSRPPSGNPGEAGARSPSGNNPYAASGNRNNANAPNGGAAAAGAGYSNRNQSNDHNAAAGAAGYSNRNQSNDHNAGAAAAGAGYSNRNQSNDHYGGAAAAGAGYANRNPYDQYHPGMVNGYWGNNYGAGGLGSVGAWGTGSPMYGYGYAAYNNPYGGGGYGVGGVGQPGAVAAVNAAGPAAYDYSQPINTAAAPPDSTVANPATASFDQARDAFRTADYDNALKLGQQALGRMPNDATMQQFVALVLFAQGNYDQAAAPLYAVLSVGPGWDWTTLIANYSDATLYTGQVRSLEKYVGANPKSAGSAFVLACHYVTQGHNQDAANLFKRVIALQPTDTLSPQLLSHLQPASATAPEAADSLATSRASAPAKLTGRWVAPAPPNATITFTVKDDGEYTWAVGRPGQTPTSIAGETSLSDGVLTLNSTDAKNGSLAGRVALQDNDHFTFRVLGAAQNDPGLSFAR